MSNTGLYSGLYDRISGHAKLLDEVLIGLKSGGSTPRDADRQKLVGLLTDLASASSIDLSLRALEMTLRDGRAGDRQTWAQLARALSGEEVDASSVQQLEAMAQAIESERAGTLAKMRGVAR